ncbi:bifunctional MaoC family dehydratase N-terminal/OB-fold nucleic acid binding domain-containing protein [Acidocella sp. KAb 2-4]|uniref:bifunctional MaoC family dehydratase N-terminal/OB-fold nucleic acid binding domain-containing protein n=1 Tax=Acidocella sp. KAb 2-4 TaxID=2885158 RepID=UPI001D074EFF|nr:MaoC family dehydratase N-terminal domain-containing protein [Acidocella sp. KAb 2-4]MCB5943444.1 MaoC family dehydratase N-terminal domain-containing protein [Acidocella sp. KAb 2-4]
MNEASDLYTQALAWLGKEATRPVEARDPVNVPMIRRWCEAIGEENPIYVDAEAAAAQGFPAPVCPPAMLEVWTMARFRHTGRAVEDSIPVLTLFDEAGYTGVVATNIEQEYDRYLLEGDRVSYTAIVDEVSPEKRTGLGIGHFVTIRYEFADQNGAPVGRMLFRVLKFKPKLAQPATAPAALDAPKHPRPAITHDNAHYWEGISRRELLIQKCSSCGHLRHPPGPGCPKCRSLDWVAVKASGRGTLYSFVTVHQPRIPGLQYPLPVLLVELEEGVRLIANGLDLPPEDIAIGMPLRLDWVEVEPGYVLPAFRPDAGEG